MGRPPSPPPPCAVGTRPVIIMRDGGLYSHSATPVYTHHTPRRTTKTADQDLGCWSTRPATPTGVSNRWCAVVRQRTPEAAPSLRPQRTAAPCQRQCPTRYRDRQSRQTDLTTPLRWSQRCVVTTTARTHKPTRFERPKPSRPRSPLPASCLPRRRHRLAACSDRGRQYVVTTPDATYPKSSYRWSSDPASC